MLPVRNNSQGDTLCFVVSAPCKYNILSATSPCSSWYWPKVNKKGLPIPYIYAIHIVFPCQKADVNGAFIPLWPTLTIKVTFSPDGLSTVLVHDVDQMALSRHARGLRDAGAKLCHDTPLATQLEGKEISTCGAVVCDVLTRYANVERSKGGDNDLDQAPAFKTFIPEPLGRVRSTLFCIGGVFCRVFQAGKLQTPTYLWEQVPRTVCIAALVDTSSNAHTCMEPMPWTHRPSKCVQARKPSMRASNGVSCALHIMRREGQHEGHPSRGCQSRCAASSNSTSPWPKQRNSRLPARAEPHPANAGSGHFSHIGVHWSSVIRYATTLCTPQPHPSPTSQTSRYSLPLSGMLCRSQLCTATLWYALPLPGMHCNFLVCAATPRYALPGKGAPTGGAGQADKDGHKEEEASRRAPVDVAPVVFSVGAGPGQAKAGAKLQELLVGATRCQGGLLCAVIALASRAYCLPRAYCHVASSTCPFVAVVASPDHVPPSAPTALFYTLLYP
eukprot:987629-Pelagomonas_calceolata.AAC.1